MRTYLKGQSKFSLGFVRPKVRVVMQGRKTGQALHVLVGASDLHSYIQPR